MKEIPLTQGKVAIVDNEDYKYLNQWKWCAIKNYNAYYAARHERGTRRFVLMHRELLKPSNGFCTDHINGNGLDNRRSNLRQATTGQNRMNAIKKNGLSPYKGVIRCRNKWQAHTMIAGKWYRLGLYTTDIEAAIAYDYIAAHAWGEFARLNFPQPDT